MINFYLWYAVIGYAFVPLGLYFTSLVKSVFVTNTSENGPHAEQAGIVVMIYAFLLSAIFIYPTYCVFGPSTWLKTFFLAYISWYTLLDRRADSSGKRFLRWSRRLPFWRNLAEYFPVRLHVSSELDPKGNYLFGYHPHGIIGVGALLTFASEATGFYKAFPGLDLRLLTLSVNFKFPFTREVLMALGVNSVTKMSVLRNLTRAPGRVWPSSSAARPKPWMRVRAKPRSRSPDAKGSLRWLYAPALRWYRCSLSERMTSLNRWKIPRAGGCEVSNCTLNNSSASHLRLFTVAL